MFFRCTIIDGYAGKVACCIHVFVLQLVLPAMKTHPRQLGVQMAATACLYNLSKSELGQKIHPQCLKHIIELTLKAMENFPNHQQVYIPH